MPATPDKQPMRIAYFDFTGGADGRAMLSALIDSGVDAMAIQQGIDSLGLPSCRLAFQQVVRNGLRGTELSTSETGGPVPCQLSDLERMLDQSAMSPRQRARSLAVFRRLANAEARVHGSPGETISSFEERGALPIALIVGVCIGCDLLAIDRVAASPVAAGRGALEVGATRFALPGPLAAELLVGIPLVSSSAEGEWTTWLGAALAATLPESFGALPAMAIERVGYGIGDQVATHASLLRVMVGELHGTAMATGKWLADSIVLLETNLDDMSGEGLGHCQKILREAGALDVATASLQMKKGRPGTWLLVQCRPEAADHLTDIIFCETSALGMRRSIVERVTLPRRQAVVKTPWGPILGMAAQLPDGRERFSPEYESCAAAAAAHDVTWDQVHQGAQAAFSMQGPLGNAASGDAPCLAST